MMGNALPSFKDRPREGFLSSPFGQGGALSDNALLEAVAAGDRGAFTILMRRYLASMVTLARRIVFDTELARDIAQEAFLRVWRHAAAWDPNGTATFQTWLRRVVVNLSISQRRRAREQANPDVLDDMPSGLADGFDILAEADRKRAVRAALEKLPERQRAAVALYYFEDLPQIQAAEILDMTPRAFDSLIVRARMKLKKHLATFSLKDMP